MDAVFAHSGKQAQPWENFKAVFDAIWAQSEGVSASFRDRRRNMGPLVHITDQEAVETVDFTRRCFEDYRFLDLMCSTSIDYLAKGLPFRLQGYTMANYCADSMDHTSVVAKAKLVQVGYEL